MRVWVDLTNTAHVLVLRPLVELLEAGGHEVELTARPLSHTTWLVSLGLRDSMTPAVCTGAPSMITGAWIVEAYLAQQARTSAD